MMPISMDNFESSSLFPEKIDIAEKLESFNKSFKTSLQPENGAYGITEIIKENGRVDYLSHNEYGHIRKDYFQDGVRFLTREKINDTTWLKTRYDDNGTAYLVEKTVSRNDMPKEYASALVPNVEVIKGNFSAVIDGQGRPILNKITDINIKESGREALNVVKDEAYREHDERGHLIADHLGGPSSLENIIPQEFKVNRSVFRSVEKAVENLKLENPDSRVDYQIKTNYDGKTGRPSSFEPTIYLDGVEQTDLLPKELQKIYNETDISKLKEIKIDTLEHIEGFRNTAEHQAGRQAGITAAVLTGAVSTIDNVSQYMEGDISAEEMVVNIAKDTGTAGAIGYGTGFVSAAVSSSMQQSSHTLISSLGTVGGGCIPAAAIAFGVESFDDIVEFAQGDIDGKELAYNLGENGAGVAGGVIGMAVTGAVVGSVVPGAGTAIGFGAGLVGGMVGCALASEGYKTAVEAGTSDEAKAFVNKAQKFAVDTVERAKVDIPNDVDAIRTSINNFAQTHSIPISV